MRKRRGNPEAQIQRVIVHHLRARGAPGVFWFSVPNGGFRRPIEAAILKATGVRAGVPDMCFIKADAQGEYAKFYALEIKAKNGRPTEAQLECISQINAAGGFAIVAQGLDTCLHVLETWGILKGTAA